MSVKIEYTIYRNREPVAFATIKASSPLDPEADFKHSGDWSFVREPDDFEQPTDPATFRTWLKKYESAGMIRVEEERQGVFEEE